MVCVICGTKISESSLICPKCGIPIVKKNIDSTNSNDNKANNNIIEELKDSGIPKFTKNVFESINIEKKANNIVDSLRGKVDNNDFNTVVEQEEYKDIDNVEIEDSVNEDFNEELNEVYNEESKQESNGKFNEGFNQDSNYSSNNSSYSSDSIQFEADNVDNLINEEEAEQKIINGSNEPIDMDQNKDNDSYGSEFDSINKGVLQQHINSKKKNVIAITLVGLFASFLIIVLVIVLHNKKDINNDKSYSTSQSVVLMTREEVSSKESVDRTDTEMKTEKETQNDQIDMGDQKNQDDYDDSVEQASISIEYLNHAPNISESIEKIPIYNASASSMLEEEINNKEHINYPSYMFDEDDKTSWQEGVEGLGSGESASVNLEGVYQVNYICFKLGNWTNEKWYSQNSRPKTLSLNIDGELIELSFPDGMEERWVKIENAPKSSYLYVYLGDAYPGTKYEDTCINEIELYGTWYDNVEY